MPLQVFCRNCAQYRNEWCKLKIDSPDPDMVRDCQYYRGITNADRIRAMSDEELADWYFNEFFRKVPYCRKEECYEDTPCEDCLLDWLKQEAE